MNPLILKAVLFAAILKAANAFKWRDSIAYVMLSVFMITGYDAQDSPEKILLYSFEIFAVYVAAGIIRHRISRAKTREASRWNMSFSLNSLMLMFSIGYFFSLLKINQYLSFLATMAFYFIFRNTKYKKEFTSMWKAIFFFTIAHSFLFYGGMTLAYPAYYVVLYIAINYIFSAVRDAFSYACALDELKEGMIPAESVVYDGEKYIFGSNPFPSVLGLVRYVAGDAVLNRRIVASYFRPLKKENINEIKRLSKERGLNAFLVQRQVDFLPFIVLGGILELIILQI